MQLGQVGVGMASFASYTVDDLGDFLDKGIPGSIDTSFTGKQTWCNNYKQMTRKVLLR